MKLTKRKKKVSRKIIPMPIYTSPDGGETIYQRKAGSDDRTKISG